jgi:hypothetical protein
MVDNPEAPAPTRPAAVALWIAVVGVIGALGALSLADPLPRPVVQEHLDADTTFDGALAGGLADGAGTVRFADGSWYTGTLVAGRFAGPGVFVTADGWRLAGTFTAGSLGAGGVVTAPDGSTHVVTDRRER